MRPGPLRRGFRLVACVLALLLTAPAQADEAAYKDKLGKVRSWQTGQLAALAKQARAKKYHTLARRCAAQAAKLGAKQDATGLDPEDGGKLAFKQRAALETKERKYHEDAARRLGALARWCTRNDLGVKADTLAREAIRHDPDAKDARAVLGEAQVPGWGWMPADDAKQVKKGLLKVGREWKKKSEVEELRADWDHAWQVLSPHWNIRSNLPLERVFAARDLLEAFHRRWMADWDGYLPLEERPKRHRVFIFRRQSEYDAHVEAKVPGYTKNVPGQYSHVVKGAFFYDVTTHAGGGNQTSTLEELMLHECAHQLFHEVVKGKDGNTTQGDPANFWLHEGIAELYGMLQPGKGGLVHDPGALGGLVRTRFLKKNPGPVKTLEQLDGMRKQGFQSADGNERLVHYAQSGFLCLYLETGAHRNVLRQAVREVYTGQNEPGLLSKLLGKELPKAQKGYEAFLKGL